MKWFKFRQVSNLVIITLHLGRGKCVRHLIRDVFVSRNSLPDIHQNCRKRIALVFRKQKSSRLHDYTLTKWLAGLQLAGIFLSPSLEKADYRWKKCRFTARSFLLQLSLKFKCFFIQNPNPRPKSKQPPLPHATPPLPNSRPIFTIRPIFRLIAINNHYYFRQKS